MKSKKISIRTFFWLVIIGLISTSAFLLLIFYLFTGNGTLVLYGLFLTVVFLGWGMLFLKFFQNKLSEFTDNLCLTLDNMIGGNERPITDMEAETVFARISYRLERLYDIMQQSRLRVEEEKAEIQALV